MGVTSTRGYIRSKRHLREYTAQVVSQLLAVLRGEPKRFGILFCGGGEISQPIGGPGHSKLRVTVANLFQSNSVGRLAQFLLGGRTSAGVFVVLLGTGI